MPSDNVANQSRSMKARFRTIPTLNDLQQLGPISLGLDVLLVDSNKDKNLVKLQIWPVYRD
ncbi:hypothetical protein KC19_VG166300 [Ceratodon purpureus]|uniref:Uncharacterized protein n=1 Tax=Ceratodon purpureus TaxID=3225 RepID=A0A8T0HR73_CERPU|nr:hypothetical protein KC19_VG166300 [Ceratodon purpureus]